MSSIRRSRKAIISFSILFLIIGSCQLIGQFIHDYFEDIKQSNLYLHQTTTKLNSTYIQRAILVYYSAHQESHFLPEIRWLYRSWIEMMKDESPYWRTDLIIYTGNFTSNLQQLGCILNQKRTNHFEPPKCRIFLYLYLSNRLINSLTGRQKIFISKKFESFFQINRQRSIDLFRNVIQYDYIDSVNIIAEAYPTFQFYNFILKTDIDVFLTRQFAKYIPNLNESLLLGLGGYSTYFNTYRLGRIARDMNWNYRNLTNIGSTWYGAPHIAQYIANLTLDAIIHLSKYEFSLIEREGKLGTILWPDWHYGVLSMYGTHLAVNHLMDVEKSFRIIKVDQLLDQSTTNTDPNDIEANNRLHLHCWHSEKDFSKFRFKAGLYNLTFLQSKSNSTSAQGYAMRMAMESQQMTLNELNRSLSNIFSSKLI